MQLFRNISLSALPLTLLFLAGTVFGAAGNVQFVIGDAKLINKAGVSVALTKGAEINEGDRITTAPGASAQIKMVDGGFIAVRPGTSMIFNTYRYNGKEDGSENAVVSLLQGGFRTITGIIGRTNKQNYLIKTETATIGIRGTDHEPMVILPPAPGQAAIAAPGTYDKVNVGVAFIRTDAGSVDIQRNQVGFAPVTKAAPVILPRIPPFYKPTPAPGPQRAKEDTKDEGKKESQQAAAATSEKTAEEKKVATPAERTAAAPAENAAATPAESNAPAPIRNTAVVDPAGTVTSVTAAASVVAAAPAALAPVVAITATDASGSTVNTTNQTVTSSTGGTTPVTQGTYGLDAQTAANAAADSAAALNTLLSSSGSTVTTTALSSALSTAQTAINSSLTATASIAALAIDTGLATSNASAASTIANTASAQVNAATAKFTANGTFVDATIAAPAMTTATNALTTLNTALTSAQNALATVTTQYSALGAAQTSAGTALTSANQALTNANGTLAALTAAGVPSTSTATDLLTTAQAAATAAQSAATLANSLQSAGDITGAQTQLAVAQQQALAAANALTNAGQIIAAVGNANTAQTAAASITAANTGLLSMATSAQAAGASAVSAVAVQLAAIQTQAALVQQNEALAQYSNPAVASSNFVSSFSGLKAVAGGTEKFADGPSTPRQNTNVVLDGSKSLVEIRNSSYQRSGFNGTAAAINNADLTFSGGTAKDLTSDPNGVYYFGRWQGGQVDVKDLATTGALAPFSDALGTLSTHWIVGLLPGNSTLPATAGGAVNNTQQIVGTSNYALAAATHPTDALGNVGTLNSATLAANFSTQTLDAALGLSFSSTDPANVSTRNFSISASASNVPIQGTGFEAKTGMPNAPVITCASTSGNCAAAYVGGFGGAFLSTAAAGASNGAVGTGVGLGYSFAPDVAAAPANQAYTDLIHGVAVLNTSAAPPVGITNFSSSAVLRDEVLWTTTQLAPGTANPATTTYIVSDKNKQNLYNNSSGSPATPLAAPLVTPVALSGPTNNTNFLFDASGNLVRIFDTPHVIFDHGSDVPGSSAQFATPTPLANVQLSFGSGGVTPENYYDANTGIRLGRWTGGVVNVTDLNTGNSYIESLQAPGGKARSLQWVVVQVPSSLPLSGTFQYTRINDASGTPSFATAPTDSYGNVGTLEGARLSADFTNMRVSAGVRISMPSGPAGSLGMQNLSARFENAPISNGGFNVGSGSDNPAGSDNLHVNCFGAGCAPDITLPAAGTLTAYGGRIRGGFDSASGNAGTADGAFMRYTFNTQYGSYGATPPTGRVVDDYINGLVAFKQGPQVALPTSTAYPTAAPTGPVVVVANYGYNISGGNRLSSGQAYWVDQPSATNPATSATYLATDTSGNLISLDEGGTSMHGDGKALALSGGTPNPATPVALAIGNSASANDGTILLGWQSPSPNLNLSGNDWNGCFGISGCTSAPAPRVALADGLSWVRGPAPFPDYLPGAIAGYTNSGGVVIPGTATYNLGASLLRDQTGTAGSVTSAGLTVNFNSASVNFNMAATSADGSWTATANGIKLSQDGSFYANSGNGARTLTSGTSIAPAGMHDGLSVVLTPTAGTVSNSWGNMAGQLMGIGVGGAGLTYDLNSLLCSGTCSNVTVSGALAFSNAQPYSTLTPYQLVAFASGMNSAGQFDSNENNRIQGGFVSPFRTQTVNGYPVKFDGELPVVVNYNNPPCTINCGPFVNNLPVVYALAGASGPASIGTASLLESGYDIGTGIRWGRYGGGTAGVNERIGGASLGTVDISNQNVHFLMSSTQSGPTVLPLTGTFNYVYAGGTTPTDSNGNVGAALTAANASLSANFTTQKVDASLSNLSVGGNTWGASASGISIQSNTFQADKKLGGGGNLAVTSSLGSNTAGALAGVFTGATGSGVGMLYSLNHGGNVATNPAAVSISGVAVFKR